MASPQTIIFTRPGKAPLPTTSTTTFPSIKETQTLEKRVKDLQRKEKKQANVEDYDDLNDLSDDDSYSSSLDGFVVRDRKARRHQNDKDDDDRSVQDLGGSSEEEEEEDDYTSSSAVSGSIHSDDDEDAEEEEEAARRRHHKKRKLEVAPVVTTFSSTDPAKEPRFSSHSHTTKQRSRQATPKPDTLRVEALNNKVALQIQELQRVNATVLENIKIVEEATALLEKKEAARTEENIFVLNHEKIKKDLETQEARLKQREEQLAAREGELQLAINAAHQLESQLVARAKEVETQESVLIKEKESLVAREKALVALPKPKPVLPTTTTPLDGFVSEMQKSNQNLISREDLCGIVPINLMCSLAYLGGKQQLKYHSLANSQYLIVEVTNVESGHLLMRQIVSKQLYNAK